MYNTNKTVYQGEDITLSVELTNDDGTPVNLDELTDVIMYLYRSAATTRIRIGKTGDVVWIRETPYKYNALIESAATKGMLQGVYKAEINFVFDSDLCSDNRLNKIVVAENIFNLKPTKIGDES